jgi:ectoine hydroxylase-related dioxygenase (phytanoyl-CoA dioxygenase family)
MKTDNIAGMRSERVWLDPEACSIEAFAALVERTTAKADYPFAAEIADNVPVYDRADILNAAARPDTRKALLAEWVEAMTDGPGIVALRGAFADTATIDAATVHFNAMIAEQHASGTGGGDHFAKPGANDRIWNALEKHCLADPEGFALYYGNEAIALASESWLGPGYQVTAQVNRVNPGGAAQTAHRDYHLGFMSPEQALRFPAHIHRLSPALTLQGAVAHGDMPVETGPTMLLPYSQLFPEGYLAFERAPFQDWFRAHHVQLPLAKGDLLFFSPALMHGAGTNRSADRFRMANLLQVSSPFGRAMEAIDRTRMTLALYPALARLLASGQLTPAQADNAIAAAAEGYAFPTNLDTDPPLGGLAPKTQADLTREALRAGTAPASFAAQLSDHAARRLP